MKPANYVVEAAGVSVSTNTTANYLILLTFCSYPFCRMYQSFGLNSVTSTIHNYNSLRVLKSISPHHALHWANIKQSA